MLTETETADETKYVWIHRYSWKPYTDFYIFFMLIVKLCSNKVKKKSYQAISQCVHEFGYHFNNEHHTTNVVSLYFDHRYYFWSKERLHGWH